MNGHDFSALAQKRRTVRDFLPTPISDETMAEILDDARHCASWSNTRAYCAAIASGERLERLKLRYVEAFDATLPLQHKKPLALVKAAAGISMPDGDFDAWRTYPPDLQERSRKVGKALYTHMGIPRGDRETRDTVSRRNVELFGAPTALWLFVHDGLLPMSALDAGLMLQTLMLSAEARGISTCALGTLAVWRHPIDREFVVPPQYKLITGLALGYASADEVNDFRAEHPPLQLLAPKQ